MGSVEPLCTNRYSRSRNIQKWGAITLLFGMLLSPFCAAQKLSQKELELARNYVLAACIMDHYPGTPLANEADAWAAGLVEDGSLPIEAYPALARLAKSAPQAKTTQKGVILRLQSCVDFVNNKGLSKRIENWRKP